VITVPNSVECEQLVKHEKGRLVAWGKPIPELGATTSRKQGFAVRIGDSTMARRIEQVEM